MANKKFYIPKEGDRIKVSLKEHGGSHDFIVSQVTEEPDGTHISLENRKYKIWREGDKWFMKDGAIPFGEITIKPS